MSKLCYFEFRPAYWTSDAIWNLTKNFSSVKYVRLKYKLKSKTERKNVPNSLSAESWSKKPIFSYFENHRHFENLLKELPNFYKKFKLSNVAKNKNI
jgi:hypothetical protein